VKQEENRRINKLPEGEMTVGKQQRNSRVSPK
jgi:hypothetical protein